MANNLSTNIGWDWGCYVQFMKWIEDQDIDKPDYLLFCMTILILIKMVSYKSF